MPKSEVSRKRQKQCISIQPGAYSVPAGYFLPAGDKSANLVLGVAVGTAQIDRRGLACAPYVPFHSERQRGTAYFLRQCTCARCEAAARIADLSPLQAACAALRLSPHEAAGSLFPCWSCEAWNRTDSAFDLPLCGQSGAWGGAPTSERRNPKGYRHSLLAAGTFCHGASNHHSKILEPGGLFF